jgi:glutamate/tyrosine decarboxylase-like PLP-dependent enzyme
VLKRVHTNPGLLPVREHREGFVQVGRYTDVPDITAAPPPLPAAWFLGPRGENSDVLAGMVEKTLRHIREYRLDYQPNDPESITENIRQSVEYKNAVQEMEKRFKVLLDYLGRWETPFFSERYAGHMLTDTTLPALAGYFGAMLHNPNNVTIQASTSTTFLEMLVMRDLCHMVGWRTSPDLPVHAWAHLTADGSVANVEGLWAARETKFLPAAIATALRQGDPRLAGAENITVPRTDGQELRIIAADNWSLLNIRRDDILALPARIAELTDLKPFDVWNLLVPYDVNAVGVPAISWALDGLGGPPVVLTPSTRHYSWPKAAALTGWGTDADQTVMVDRDARMSMPALRKRLTTCLRERIPVLMTVAVNGSTEESAIDPLTDILALRDQFRDEGLEFDIHVDAAWGGYLTSVIRKPYGLVDDDVDHPFVTDTSGIPLSDYSIAQFEAIRHADSVTIDPHKMGYIQYPAGSLLYRNMEVINLLTFTGAYIGAATDPTVGMFGIEGSKPGAAAAAVFFSHMCIRPSVEGYGRIMSYSLANARQFYTRLLFMTKPEDQFRCVPLALLPAERDGGDVPAQLDFLHARIHGRTTKQIEADPAAMALFRQIGPDQNIVDYGFNPLGNTDPDTCNAFIQDIYNAFHVNYNKDGTADDIHRYRALVTMTTFDRESYGDEFMSTFARRLGLVHDPVPESLNCLRSTIMNPFVSDTVDGSFLDTLITILGDEVRELVSRR